MPKIPLMQSGRLDHTRATVPITDLVNANYGMEGPRQLGRLAEIIGRSGEDLGRSVSQVTRAYADFEAAKVDTENRIAAVDDRNLFAFHQNALEQKLRSNPGASDQEKQEWIDQTDRDYAAAREDIVSRMSTNFRRLHDAAMTGERQHAADRRRDLIIQGGVTRDTNQALGQLDTAARNNDADLYNDIVAMHEGRLFTAEQAQKMRDDFPRLSQSYAAQARVAADDPRILDDLESGKVYPAIPDQYREKLLRAARANDARRRGDQNWKVYSEIESGKITTDDDIKKPFEGRTSPRDLEQMKQQLDLLHRHESRQRQIAQHERAEQNQQIRLKNLQEQEEAKRRKKQVNKHLYDIIRFQFPADPNERETIYQAMRWTIIDQYVDDGETVSRLINRLKEQREAADRKFAAPAGAKPAPEDYVRESMKQYIEDKFKDLEVFTGDTNLFGIKTETGDYSDINFAVMKKKAQEWLKNHPGATAEQAQEWVQQSAEFIGRQAAPDLPQAWRDLPGVIGVDLDRLRGDLAANYREALVRADEWFRQNPKATVDDCRKKIDDFLAELNGKTIDQMDL